MADAGAVHVPVLLREVVAALRPERGGVYVDATLGLGSHARALLEASPEVRVVGIDRDPEALLLAKQRLAAFGTRLVIVEGRHEDLAEHLDRLGLARVDGILADLGVSTMQLDRAERGFSFMKEGPLDMRMGADGPTAADLVATASREELTRIFREWGEERMAGPIARTVVEARKTAPIRTTGEMRRLVLKVLRPRREMHKDPATRVFQALRIATNHELVELERFLDDAIARLALGARLSVLSYHSLEDRIVKRAFQRHTAGCTCPPSFPVCVCSRRRVMALVTRKSIRPSLAELGGNPRARSARMRVLERIAQDGAGPLTPQGEAQPMAYAVRRPVENVYLVRERDRRRTRELAALALAAVPPAIVLFLAIWANLETVRLGYQLATLARMRETLFERRHLLEMDRAQAVALARVERIALGTLVLVPPTLDQVILVKDTALVAPGPPALPPGKVLP